MSAVKLPGSFEQDLDEILKSATETLPGVVVMAKNGDKLYHKAFGFSDMERQLSMDKDAKFRMYSMTKVMTSTLALMLREKVKEPELEDEVSKYIPSFGREWDVVEEVDCAPETVDVRSMITGQTERVSFARRRVSTPIRIKHLMSECSGIGYECFSDMEKNGNMGDLGTKQSFAIANALRRKVSPSVYTSSCILGHDLTVEEFSDKIAEAGVLCTEPGCLSYGLGAAVLGRVIEIVYEKHFGRKPLRDLFQDLLFGPLSMTSAVFFDKNLENMPKLYGVRMSAKEGEEHTVVPAEESVPEFDPPYSNQRDHYAGPMKYDSGDTGSAMSVADYAKFLECLLNDGVASDGTRILPQKVVDALLNMQHADLSFQNGLSKKFGLSDDGAVFTFGWTRQKAAANVRQQNYWSGYAGTHFRIYPQDQSYIILGIQCMDHAGTGLVFSKLQNPCLDLFSKQLESEDQSKRQKTN